MESLESMDIREAAQYLHRSERSLRRYLQAGRLEHSKESLPAGGFRYLISRQSLDTLKVLVHCSEFYRIWKHFRIRQKAPPMRAREQGPRRNGVPRHRFYSSTHARAGAGTPSLPTEAAFVFGSPGLTVRGPMATSCICSLSVWQLRAFGPGVTRGSLRYRRPGKRGY